MLLVLQTPNRTDIIACDTCVTISIATEVSTHEFHFALNPFLFLLLLLQPLAILNNNKTNKFSNLNHVTQ